MPGPSLRNDRGLHLVRTYERPIHDSDLQQIFQKAVKYSGMSGRELARRSGVSKEMVRALLKGERGGSLQMWSWLLEAADLEVIVQKKESHAR